MAEFLYQRRVLVLFAILLLLVYFPLFLHLDYMPFRMWDESILGINAINMMADHNYIVTHFYGQPDIWNCKPPVMIWCIVLFSRLLGFGELALRLPSALAALFLCIYLFFVLRKYTGNSVFGFLTVVILVTCNGYIRNHVTRTGEYDSLLVSFSALMAMNLFLAVQAIEKRKQSAHLFLFFIFLTLAVLTKGIACMMLMPGLFIYTLAHKRVLPFLKNKAFYAGLIFFLVFGAGYYFLRETMNHGYLQAVW
ncbi:MAG TPA: glycosyltransferase family 39 protein, partial [Chitinophagales bacterium]|nr:glycosyltransferase family 39 protein [Chitinophagales bacterium]